VILPAHRTVFFSLVCVFRAFTVLERRHPLPYRPAVGYPHHSFSCSLPSVPICYPPSATPLVFSLALASSLAFRPIICSYPDAPPLTTISPYLDRRHSFPLFRCPLPLSLFSLHLSLPFSIRPSFFYVANPESLRSRHTLTKISENQREWSRSGLTLGSPIKRLSAHGISRSTRTKKMSSFCRIGQVRCTRGGF
jgi:hypothetical protein